MKFYEALRAIENGKKVRFIKWPTGSYCCLDNDGDVVDQNGALLLDAFQIQLLNRDLWEEYQESGPQRSQQRKRKKIITKG